MSSVEAFGGKCPNCSQMILQKWDSWSSAFMFDACPFCGFACSISSGEEEHGAEVFHSILKAHRSVSLEQLVSLHNFNKLSDEEMETADRGEFSTTVLDYSMDTDLKQYIWNTQSHADSVGRIKKAYEAGLLCVDILAKSPKQFTVSQSILEEDGIKQYYGMSYNVRFKDEPSENWNDVLVGTLDSFKVEEAFAITGDAYEFGYSDKVVALGMGLEDIAIFCSQ